MLPLDASQLLTRRLIKIIWALPFIWVLGGERLLLPVLLIVLTYKWAMPLGRMPRPFFFFFLFLMAYLVSGIQVQSLDRLITFTWDFAIYLSLFFVALALGRSNISFKDAESIIWHLVIFMFLVNLLGFTYFIFGGWKFPTPIGMLLPGGIKGTAIGAKIAMHGIGHELYFVGLRARLSSIFFSAMQYAAVILITLPAIYYFIAKSGFKSRLFYFAILLSALVAGVFAQGRAAMVLGVFALVVMIFSVPLANSRGFNKGNFWVAAALILFLGALWSALNFSFIYAKYEEFFLETRAFSATERFEVYEQSQQKIFDSPIIGHGTQVDVDELGIPLGSHNWYLGVIFKHGLLGIIPFVLFLASILFASYKVMFSSRASGDGRQRAFGLMLLVSIGGHCVLSVTAEPAVDAIHVFILAIYYGIVVSLARQSLSVGLR